MPGSPACRQEAGTLCPRDAPGGRSAAIPYPSVFWICIDPGHGGSKDRGACSITGAWEKDYNLSIALLFRYELVRAGFKVVMTREDDRYVSLARRVAIGRNCDLFISIHSNSTPQRQGRASGYELYYSAARRSSIELASAMAGCLGGDLELRLRRVKSARFYVLRKNSKPAILIELGFLNNDHDEAIIAAPVSQKIIAACLASKLARYIAIRSCRKSGKSVRRKPMPSPRKASSTR